MPAGNGDVNIIATLAVVGVALVSGLTANYVFDLPLWGSWTAAIMTPIIIINYLFRRFPRNPNSG